MIPVLMTLQAIHCNVCAGQWEVGIVMIERTHFHSCRVTGQTGIVLINITANSCMIVVGLRIKMAINAGKLLEIAWIVMTVFASRPYRLVRTGIDRKIHGVMWKSRWSP